LDVKNAMRQLLNRYKKQLQENMHKVSEHILLLSWCTSSNPKYFSCESFPAVYSVIFKPVLIFCQLCC